VPLRGWGDDYRLMGQMMKSGARAQRPPRHRSIISLAPAALKNPATRSDDRQPDNDARSQNERETP
jgi:hypothetical protein